MRPQGFLIAAAFAALSVAIWAYINQPEAEPEWPQKVQGFAFSPYQADQDALLEQFPTPEEIGSDLDLLQGKTNAVRTYSTIGTLNLVPALAAERGINVAVGAWVDTRLERNETEIEGAIELANNNRNVVRVVVGNEVILRGDMPVSQLTAYLDRVREAVGQPVSTAEPWHVWLKNPELADHVDYITLHLLPYWEGIDVEQSVQRSIDSVKQIRARFPDKQLIIGEVGWPSNGRTRESAVASASNEALFLRRFLAWAEREGYVYYIMEAFDQPWKGNVEGAVGAYWGVYDAQRNPKFEFTKPIVRVPEWHVLAAISVVLAALMLFVFYINSGTLRNRGRTFLALIVYATSALTTWIVYDYTQQYLTMTSVAVGVLLLIGMVGVIAVLMAEAHEWAEAHWVRMRRRLFASESMLASDYRPKVSIHVPAYNEPPAMVIETLDALAQLEYPDFEVLLVDNNTPDEATWRPVEAHCAKLGPRFRFIHVDGLEGFKAGALNLALRETAADAEIIAVIDSDYVVRPDWLRSLVPAFADRQMSIVQAPQDYRDEGASAFKAMCHAEYRGFFHIGMVTRNERNAIIQHGTMTLVRRTALEETGGWAEWCITEDAELGLRLFERGYDATYIPQSFGKGLMPDTFIDFKKQRFRWAYGAMQILRRHAAELLGPEPTQLTSGQRYHFIAGWLPWLADGFNLFFNFAALVWTVLMVVAPTQIDPPLAVFSVLPLSLFAFKLVKLMHLYRVRVGAGIRQTVAASLAGLALSHTIGIAVVKGLFTNREPFFRTPKNAAASSVRGALLAAREELLMVIAMWLAAWAVMQTPLMSSPDLSAWIIVLCVQSIPYLSAVVVSVISALPWPARIVGTGYRVMDVEDAPPAVAAAPAIVEPAAPTS